MFEMATGRMPFERKTVGVTFAAIQHEPTEPVTRLNSEVPRKLEKIISKALARANALQARTFKGDDAKAARMRTLTDYKNFLTLWKDADPDIPVLRQAKAENAKLR